MKIGILTFHKSINYGSVLQAYALKNTLEKNGHDVEIIDYEPKIYKKQYGMIEHYSKIKSTILVNLKHLVIADILYTQFFSFRKFRNEFFNLSKSKFFYNSKFEQLNNIYDCIVCGSDQIWNVHAMDSDPIYFLPISHECRKVAFSVSVNNTDYTEQECDEVLRQRILDFDFISIREQSGAKKLNDFLGQKKQINVTLDPTLLLDKEEYELIESPRLVKGKYIFMYCAYYTDDTIEVACKLSERTGYPVYTLVVNRSVSCIYGLKGKGIHIIRWANKPGDFISYIKNAEYVITNSFHGTAFSIIFEKRFWSVNDVKEDGIRLWDERLVNILGKLELMNRLITKEQFLGMSLQNKDIPYDEVNIKRKRLIAESISLLKDAVGDE